MRYKYLSVIFILSFIIILLAISVIPANAYQSPEIKDGLALRWHPGNICLPCHYTLLNIDEAKSISRSCKNCHKYALKNAASKYNVDMAKISDIHNNIVCIRCHVGRKENTDTMALENNITASDFHRIMNKVGCLNCHNFENGNYVKPKKTNCSDCHVGGPHVVHGERLENMCILCHGKYVEEYKLKLPTVLKQIDEPVNKKEGESMEFPTIGKLIGDIIGSFFQFI